MPAETHQERRRSVHVTGTTRAAAPRRPGVPRGSGAALTGDDLIMRWPAARPFVVVGSACTVAGGLVAAVTRPIGFELGPWLAAYLVLVGGVAQVALGVGQAWLAETPPRRLERWAEIGAWNLGLAATVIGTMAAAPILTTVGGIASVVALGLFLVGVRVARVPPRRARPVYRGLAAFVLLSVPVGLILAWVRHA